MGFMSPPSPPGPDPELKKQREAEQARLDEKRNKMSVVQRIWSARSVQTFLAQDLCKMKR